MILLVLPQLIVHEIDALSPLLPPSLVPSKARDFPVPNDVQTNPPEVSFSASQKAAILKYLDDEGVEVIALVEGTDSSTGGPVQARHSYLVSEMVWDQEYKCCVKQGEDGYAVIDFDKFHLTEPIRESNYAAGLYQSKL